MKFVAKLSMGALGNRKHHLPAIDSYPNAVSAVW